MIELYYIRLDDTRHGVTWVPVPGRRLNLPGLEEYDLFLHQGAQFVDADTKDVTLGGWVISEGQTGYALSPTGKREKDALIKATLAAITELLRKDPNELHNKIVAQVADTGLSPKYVEAK